MPEIAEREAKETSVCLIILPLPFTDGALCQARLSLVGVTGRAHTELMFVASGRSD